MAKTPEKEAPKPAGKLSIPGKPGTAAPAKAGTEKQAVAPPKAPKAKKPRKPSEISGLLLEQHKPRNTLKLTAIRQRKPDELPWAQRFLRAPLYTLGEWFRLRPDWLDDLTAVALVSFGVVSILALLNTAPVDRSAFADRWADFLSQLFGRVGGVLFAVMMIGLGVVIASPRFGLRVGMPWRRILAMEVAFMALLAALHLLANDPEPRALARSGAGGGHVGWALGELMRRLFGQGLGVVLYVIILAFALSMVFGVRRHQVRTALKAFGARADQWGGAVRKRAAKPILPQKLTSRLAAWWSAFRTALKNRPRRQHVAPLEADGSPAPIINLTPNAYVEPNSSQPAEAPSVMPVPIATPPRLRPAASMTMPVVRQPEADPDVMEPAPAVPLSTPIPLGHDLEEHPAAPPALAASLRPAKPAKPEPPKPIPRRVREFTVDDFQELRVALPREGLPAITMLGDAELDKPSAEEINTNARIIENTLLEFDIDVEVIDVKVGPTVTQYAVQPYREMQTNDGQIVTQRVRVNKIMALVNDLGLALAAKRLRIQPFVPGFSYMGIEVPNRKPSTVALRPVMESESFARAFQKPDPDAPGGVRRAPLTIPLGRDVSGDSVVVDLATMPHLLIAGTTGSGKSVAITAMIASLVLNNLPDRLKLVLLDPKMVELARFNGLPHLVGPVETDHERIIGVLRWATREMDRRYKLLETESARNIEVYNSRLGADRAAEHLPYMAIFVDEIGDLMLSRPEEMERTVTRLAQMARAVGMHLVIATQRPSTDIITGLIKANFPSRISFMVTSNTDSRVVLDTPGAETLMGRGDMLYLAADSSTPRRVQGCFISDEELDAITAWWARWEKDRLAAGGPALEPAPWDRGMTRREALSETDALLEETIDMVVKQGEASVTLIQRGLNIPYARAAKLMDLLGELGLLGPMKEDGRSREVLMKPGSDPYKKLMAKYKKR
jgi:DNA segregation ATPase FtsK/SpoIIIE, S-DNA-T family